MFSEVNNFKMILLLILISLVSEGRAEVLGQGEIYIFNFKRKFSFLKRREKNYERKSQTRNKIEEKGKFLENLYPYARLRWIHQGGQVSGFFKNQRSVVD